MKCHHAAFASQTLIRADLDQITSSLSFLEEKIRGRALWASAAVKLKHIIKRTSYLQYHLIFGARSLNFLITVNDLITCEFFLQCVYVKKQRQCTLSVWLPTCCPSLKCWQKTQVQASKRCSRHCTHRSTQPSHTRMEEERRRQRRQERLFLILLG